jgi:hypothetical protein
VAAPVLAAADHRTRWVAAAHVSVVVDISAAFAPGAERISAVRLMSAARALVAGRRCRGLPRDRVSTVNVHLWATAFRTGPPTTGER